MKIGPVVVIVLKSKTHQAKIKAVQELSDRIKATANKLTAVASKLVSLER